MRTITFNLPVNKGIAEKITNYAKKRKTSVSDIAENYFAIITAQDNEEQEISSLVKSFSIENIDVPADFDYKEILAQTKNEKYQL